MTGYQSKRAAALDKLEQWDTPSEAFNEWWNGEYDDSTNPFTKYSLAYWAFAGWQAALAQPEQEPWPEEPFGHMAGGVQPAQEPWVGLTESERNDIEDYCEMIIGKAAFDAIEAKLQEKNT
jgi:hypothetical protein